MVANFEVPVELSNLLLAPPSHLWDEEEGGDGEEEAGDGIEEEDVDATHGVEHGLEEEGDEEPDEGAHQDRQRDHLVPDLGGKGIKNEFGVGDFLWLVTIRCQNFKVSSHEDIQVVLPQKEESQR